MARVFQPRSKKNKKNQNITRTCQLIFANDFKFDSQILECESTRKVYITYTNWCVDRMMQGKERTTIHLDFGLRSGRASDKVGRSLQVGFFWKSTIHCVQVQFSETVYRLTSWNRILKQLPTLKTQNTGKRRVKVYTGTAQVCFWIVVYKTENVTKFYSGLQDVPTDGQFALDGLSISKFMS